jgi:hypothetical protein
MIQLPGYAAVHSQYIISDFSLRPRRGIGEARKPKIAIDDELPKPHERLWSSAGHYEN